MNPIHIGKQVDIKRSDGRVHQATVTKVLPRGAGVSVQWFEDGSEKAKEIAWEVLIRTNPSLSAKENVSAAIGSALASSTPVVNDAPRSRLPISCIKQPQCIDLSDLDETLDRSAQFEPAISHRMSLGVASTNSKDIDTSLLSVNGIGDQMAQPISKKITQLKNTANSAMNRTLKNQVARSTCVASKQSENKKTPVDPNIKFREMIQEYRANVAFEQLRSRDTVVENRICVSVRKRPMNAMENAKKEIEIVTIPNKDSVIIHQPQVKVDLTKYLENQSFRFDYAFDESVDTEMVYRFTAQPLVRTIFEGGFATCFAYGQTGAGKTHTMGGDFTSGKKQNAQKGIYAFTARDVFEILETAEYRNENISVFCAFFEIYGSNVFDLLNKKAKLRVLEDGKKCVQVVGLHEQKASNVEEVLALIHEGSDRRTAGQTSANSNSSRSHAVFQIILRKKEKNKNGLYGKFSLIDLAGNERGKQANVSDRVTQSEGAEINKSLLALKECVRAMGRDESHVPFRGSKLTLVLRDSFIGQNAKMCMIANIGPGMSSVEDTVNTLRYAHRVKEL